MRKNQAHSFKKTPMKKTFIKLVLTFIILIASASFLYSQPGNKPKQTKAQRDKVYEAKKVYFKQELQLTEIEAQKFWPIYDELHLKIRANRKEERTIVLELKQNINQLSEDDVVSKSQQLFDLQMAMIQLKKSYLSQFEQILGKKRAVNVYILEDKFKKELMQRLKSNSH